MYTYMVECADGTLYTGWTTDLYQRLSAHNAGRGAKYTKSRRPVRLVYAEAHEEKRTAMQREYHIKQMTRSEKETLLHSESNCLLGEGQYLLREKR
jgi:putative endonuclease